MTSLTRKSLIDRHEQTEAVQNITGRMKLYARPGFKLCVTQMLHLHFHSSLRARRGLGAGLACILANLKSRSREVISIIEGLQP